ncbi:hypothetical protein QBC44DRAFT_308152 [Cladorrhinum sp. PSN332]|nr:hypothetical protein QBC44DRAFT_308152 [Cladorrhinum sp. PSN332]
MNLFLLVAHHETSINTQPTADVRREIRFVQFGSNGVRGTHLIRFESSRSSAAGCISNGASHCLDPEMVDRLRREWERFKAMGIRTLALMWWPVGGAQLRMPTGRVTEQVGVACHSTPINEPHSGFRSASSDGYLLVAARQSKAIALKQIWTTRNARDVADSIYSIRARQGAPVGNMGSNQGIFDREDERHMRIEADTTKSSNFGERLRGDRWIDASGVPGGRRNHKLVRGRCDGDAP